VRLIKTTPALCALAVALASCGGGNSDGGAGSSTQSDAAAKQPVALKVADLPSRTTKPAVTISGTAPEGTEVNVDGKPVLLDGTKFRARVKLDLGTNRIKVDASRFGDLSSTTTVSIKRVEAPKPPTTVSQPPAGGGDNGNPCPPGQEPVTHMGPTHCGKLAPADPGQCPPGQVPVGSTGACGPPEDTPPDQGSGGSSGGGGGGDQGQGGGGDQGQGQG
jgi:hypothetical protein